MAGAPLLVRLTREFVAELSELGITPAEMQAMLRLELSGGDRSAV